MAASLILLHPYAHPLRTLVFYLFTIVEMFCVSDRKCYGSQHILPHYTLSVFVLCHLLHLVILSFKVILSSVLLLTNFFTVLHFFFCWYGLL